jgi:hypothetical protein
LLICGVIVFGLPGVSIVLERMPLFSKADNLRLVLGVQFAGAMLAGAAWTQLAAAASRLGLALLVTATWGIAGVLGVLLFVHGSLDMYSHVEGLTKLWTDATVPAPMEHRSLRTLVSLVFAILAAFWSLLCWRRLRPRLDRSDDDAIRGGLPRLASLAIMAPAGLSVVLTIADLTWVAYGLNPVAPARAIFPEPPAILRRLSESIGDGRLIATDEILAPNLAMVYGFRDLRGYDFPLDRRWAKLFRRLGWKPGITLLPRYQVATCVRPTVQSVADKCSVRFLYTSAEQNGGAPPPSLPVCDTGGVAGHEFAPWKMIARGVGTATDVVYENPTAYPRAYLAKRATYAAGETALDAVLEPTHDLRDESFVEQPLDELATGDDSPGTATIEFDGSEEVTIQTQSTRPSLLVVTDRYDPNWRVQVDGRDATALRANYLFRGVIVPAGEHQVRWTYRPRSVVWGSAISLVTLVTLLVLAARRSP